MGRNDLHSTYNFQNVSVLYLLEIVGCRLVQNDWTEKYIFSEENPIQINYKAYSSTVNIFLIIQSDEAIQNVYAIDDKWRLFLEILYFCNISRVFFSFRWGTLVGFVYSLWKFWGCRLELSYFTFLVNLYILYLSKHFESFVNNFVMWCKYKILYIYTNLPLEFHIAFIFI